MKGCHQRVFSWKRRAVTDNVMEPLCCSIENRQQVSIFGTERALIPTPSLSPILHVFCNTHFGHGTHAGVPTQVVSCQSHLGFHSQDSSSSKLTLPHAGQSPNKESYKQGLKSTREVFLDGTEGRTDSSTSTFRQLWQVLGTSHLLFNLILITAYKIQNGWRFNSDFGEQIPPLSFLTLLGSHWSE